jgi:hypothetical protein
LIEALDAFKRQALHATRLALEHPLTGKTLEFEAPVPADMQALLDVLEADLKASLAAGPKISANTAAKVAKTRKSRASLRPKK